MRKLLLSKLEALCRRMTSSMRGCCHRPGVEVAEEVGVCCCVVCCCVDDTGALIGVEDGLGTRLSFGRTMGDVVAGVAGFWMVRLFEEEDERTSAVVDIVYLLVWLIAVVVADLTARVVQGASGESCAVDVSG